MEFIIQNLVKFVNFRIKQINQQIKNSLIDQFWICFNFKIDYHLHNNSINLNFLISALLHKSYFFQKLNYYYDHQSCYNSILLLFLKLKTIFLPNFMAKDVLKSNLQLQLENMKFILLQELIRFPFEFLSFPNHKFYFFLFLLLMNFYYSMIYFSFSFFFQIQWL